MLTMREAAAAVRDLREQRGWTQSVLADRARVSRSFVADVEAGKPTTEAQKLFDVFQALGFEVALRSLDDGETRW
ncbi:helix-turn-helix domain-containing protein [Paramicrobacterium sp. CJ85]|uniref:helix-turn-helix domain-containing protein n=1 Tax=Paramicrobacterium sp. CJ85 TaxID=3445355 RepID=UPI003F648EE4